MTDLFRKEAIEHAARRIDGEVVVARSISVGALSWLSVAFIASGAIFLAISSYARKETVPGWLTTAAGVVRVNARGDGVVDQLLVQEGQTVIQGQPLAAIRSVTVFREGDTYSDSKRNIAERANSARDATEAGIAKLHGEMAHLARERATVRLEIDEGNRRFELQTQRIALARGELERAESVAAQGYMTRRELEARRSALLSAELEASSAKAHQLAQRRQAADVEARLRDIPLEITQLRSELANVSAQLSTEQAQGGANADYVIVAPVSGRIAALPLFAGEAVTRDSVVSVVTAGPDELSVELFAPSRTAGFIAAGQDVRVALDAYPHQRFGTLKGKVTSVSPTLLAPSEVRMPGAAFSEPVLRVTVRLQDTSLQAYGERISLRPGLAASASIILDRLSLLEWLLDPLYAVGRRI